MLLKNTIKAWIEQAKDTWLVMRNAQSTDAYERYLAHWRQHHADQGGKLLSREAFFKEELERKWNGFKRCC